MPELLIELTINFESPAIYTKFLPTGEQDRIEIVEDDIAISIIHRPESTWWASQPDQEKIERTINNAAHRIFVEARAEVRTELANFVLADTKSSQRLADEYLSLGRRIQISTIKRLNRLGEFIGALKGQYWIDRFQVDEVNPSQFFIAHDAKVTTLGKRVRFDPQIRTINVVMSDETTYVTKDDWPAIRDFVASDKRVPLIRSLLSNAFRLASQDMRRNALVEAVTALEVALHDFAEKTSDNRIARFQGRLEGSRVSGLIHKAGLRGSFGVALPLLFNDDEFPTTLLEACRAAIDRRNSIVHQGTRDVDPKSLAEYLGALEKACSLLDALSTSKA